MLRNLRDNLSEFNFHSTSEILTPGGRIFTRTIDLRHFRAIDKPGRYTVACGFALGGDGTAQTRQSKPVVRSRFQLTILARTPERVAKVLDELVAKARSAPERDIGEAMARIARFGLDNAAPRLIALARQGPLPQRVAAYGALPLAPTEAASRPRWLA